MNKPLTLLRKIKLFLYYLANQKDGILIQCPYCGSTDIEYMDRQKTKSTQNIVYNGKYKCNNCSAECYHHQEWYKAM